MTTLSNCTSEPVVQADELSKVYTSASEGGRAGRHIDALAGVSLEIHAGESVAVVGRSGSGKSTLLNLLGLIDQPSAGRLRIAGIDVSGLTERTRTQMRRHQIGIVFQFFNLLPVLSAAENVMLPAILSGRPNREARKSALRLLERVGLGDRADHRPYQLSGGEMQRAAIARALIMDPPLLLADEPTGNLDTDTGESVLSLLTGSVSERRTLVLVTHDPGVAARLGRIIRMRDGRICAGGTDAETSTQAPAGRP